MAETREDLADATAPGIPGTFPGAPTPRWVQLAWRLYAPFPVACDRPLRTLVALLRPLGDLRVPLVRLSGPTPASGGIGSLVIAGRRTAARSITARFFAAAPRVDALPAVPLWGLAGVLARLRPTVDATIAALDRHWAIRLLGDDHLLVPQHVGQVVPVGATVRVAALGRPVQRQLRHALPQLSAEVSHAPADFEQFYRTMYLPFARRRFESRAIILDIQKLARAFRHGGLLWARRDGRRVAGCLFMVRGDVLQALVLGTADGDLAVEEAGVLSALYFFALEYAVRRGLAWMDLGHAPPILSGGLLRHKSWWGARLIDTDAAPTYLAVRWAEPGARVRRLLARHPLIFRDGVGLSALTALDGVPAVPPDAVVRRARSLVLPGLERLVMMAPAGREAEYVRGAVTSVPSEEACTLEVCRGAEVWEVAARPRSSVNRRAARRPDPPSSRSTTRTVDRARRCP